MGKTAKIRHRRARAKAKAARRWFTKGEIAEAGLLRTVNVIAGDPVSERYLVDSRSAEQIRAHLAIGKEEVV